LELDVVQPKLSVVALCPDSALMPAPPVPPLFNTCEIAVADDEFGVLSRAHPNSRIAAQSPFPGLIDNRIGLAALTGLANCSSCRKGTFTGSRPAKVTWYH